VISHIGGRFRQLLRSAISEKLLLSTIRCRFSRNSSSYHRQNAGSWKSEQPRYRLV